MTAMSLTKNGIMGPIVSGNRACKGIVLVVDDEPCLVKSASRLLSSMGFEVLIAEGGPQAVEICRARGHEIDLVLLDLVLREMTSVEPLRQMRALRPDIKVILTSGYSEQECLDHFAGAMPDRFLQKPFGYEALNTAMQTVLYPRGTARPTPGGILPGRSSEH